MNRVRPVLTVVLLCGFAALGVMLTVLCVMLTGLDTGSWGTIGTVLEAMWTVLLVSALLLTLPALAALLLLPRHPGAGRAVACMLGLGVFAATAAEARDDGGLLWVNLAGLALLVCALPLPAVRGERETR